MPTWAGIADQNLNVKGKPKPKGKGKPKPRPKPEPRVGGDAELEKLQIQRNAILTARKWQSSVLAISQEVAKSLGDAATVADATGFSDVVKTRFDKLMALAPKVELSPSKTALASGSHESLRSAVSPISKAKVQQLDHPTKKSLSEYDKSMSSLESSLNKAIKSCNQYVTKAKLEEERERAKKVRLEQLREKEEKKRKQELAKAKAAGKALADQEGGQETAEQNGEEENDEDVWPLVSTADELLTSPLSKHVRDIKSPSATEPTVFDFAVDRLTKHLIDVKLYDPSECKKMRQKNPDGAANFISKGHVHPLTCFEDEPDSDVHKWLHEFVKGSIMLHDSSDEKLKEANLSVLLAPKVSTTGANWQCTTFADFMFGKVIMVLDGDQHFVAGLPMKSFTANITKGNKTIVDVSTSLGSKHRTTLENEEGGFFVYLKKGQGITIPPGYLTFQANNGIMEWTNCSLFPEGDFEGCDLFAPCLQSRSSLFQVFLSTTNYNPL